MEARNLFKGNEKMEVNGAHEQAEDGHVSHKSKFPTGPRVNSVEKIYGVPLSLLLLYSRKLQRSQYLFQHFGNPFRFLSCYNLVTLLENGLDQDPELIWK